MEPTPCSSTAREGRSLEPADEQDTLACACASCNPQSALVCVNSLMLQDILGEAESADLLISLTGAA